MERLDLHEGDQIAFQATKLETRMVLRPELQKVLDKSWEQDEPGYRYLADRSPGLGRAVAGVVYLDVVEVIGIHVQVMERTGHRSQGIRAQNELESAIARPQMAAYDERADLIRQATLLAVGISQKQPFVDGNTRTAFVTADAFLRLNGIRVTGNGIDFARQPEAVAERTDSLDAATDRFEAWLRENTVPISPPGVP